MLDQQHVIDAIELDRLAHRAIDDLRLAFDLHGDAGDRIKAVKVPGDLARGIGSSSEEGHGDGRQGDGQQAGAGQGMVHGSDGGVDENRRTARRQVR